MNKYVRKLNISNRNIIVEPWHSVVSIDVYDVLRAFRTNSAPIDHAIKKLLVPGARGVKNRTQDINEAIQSLQRELEILNIAPNVTYGSPPNEPTGPGCAPNVTYGSPPNEPTGPGCATNVKYASPPNEPIPTTPPLYHQRSD